MTESIIVENVSKTFKLHHEKSNSVYELVTGFINKNRNYENLEVLKNISFSVKKGEMLGILGRNGVGKTTLLRILAGIYKPDKGRIIVNGKLIPFLSLGSGFQPELTATSNALLYGILLGMSRNEAREKVDKIIKFAELEKFADTKLKHFSAGMFARLAFSTAIHVEPDILLLDEIISVGDLSFQQKSFDSCLSFKKKGKSIVLVTHSMEPVKQYCDRAILLNNGKIEVSGNPELVINEYQKLSFGK